MKANTFLGSHDYVKPTAIYLHIPFCRSKCKYCDFYSEICKQEKLKSFIVSLKKEISLYAQVLPSLNIETIYFGGGTPSLLEPVQVEELLTHIFEKFSRPLTGEITLEANPDSLTENKIAAYNSKGISRISLGIQSLKEEELQFLGRIHDSKSAVTTIELVKKYFDNYNIDLIFGLPDQKLSQFKYSLERIVNFRPPHISVYNLQIGHDTPLGKRLKQKEIQPLSEEIESLMFANSIEILQGSGYKHYEISNFALPGFSSIHNQIYWHYQPYLGLGPAAHSFSGTTRYYNYSDIKQYCQLLEQNQLPIAEKNELSQADLISETMIMGLRLLDGISKKKFLDRFGIKIEDVYSQQIDNLTNQGLLANDNDKIFLTEKGIFLGNQVFQEFLLDNEML